MAMSALVAQTTEEKSVVMGARRSCLESGENAVVVGLWPRRAAHLAADAVKKIIGSRIGNPKTNSQRNRPSKVTLTGGTNTHDALNPRPL